MFYWLSDRAHKPSTAVRGVSHLIALSTILFGVVFFTACGGSGLSNSNTAAAGNSAASLSVTASLPTAAVGSAYSGALTVSGGTPPYTYSTSSGDLPQGVALSNTTGAISGTPTASGSFTFTVLVSDSKGLSKQQPLQITVANATDVAVSVTPSASTVAAGASTQFSAQVSNTTDAAVTWTASQGTISSTGLYSAPQVSSNTTVTISAASIADPAASASASITVNPPSSQTGGNSFSNLQRSDGWGQFGQQGPKFIDCSPSPCDGIAFWMAQGVNSPSISGDSTEYDLGGTAGFSDALWNNHLIGPSSSQGMPDSNRTLVPSLHDFTYDVYFFGYDLGLSQALEFDINQFFGNMGFIFGHECRIASGHEWDVWNNQTTQWIPTGIPCYPKSNAWNHLTIKVQRTSNNQLTYQSITLNGVTSNLNWTYNHGSTPGWYGVTINYQMDGNQQQNSYNVYLDNLTFSYN
jgi:hypothetical protein